MNVNLHDSELLVNSLMVLVFLFAFINVVTLHVLRRKKPLYILNILLEVYQRIFSFAKKRSLWDHIHARRLYQLYIVTLTASYSNCFTCCCCIELYRCISPSHNYSNFFQWKQVYIQCSKISEIVKVYNEIL